MGLRAAYAYAWDLAGFDRPGAARDNLARARDAGLDTITLALAYHAGKFLQPARDGGRVVFPEDGTVYFRSDMAGYGAVKPLVSALTRQHDAAGDLARAGIALNAWTVLLHNTRLGQLHPDMVARNAFGDGYVYSLCPAQPEVRRYAVALCADIARNTAARDLILETPGYLRYAHGYHHEFAQVRSNAWLDAMLGLCFCEACIAGATRAGIPAAALQARVAASIDGYLRAPVDAPADMAMEWLAADLVDGDFAAFARWRCDTVTSLVAEIRAAVPKDRGVWVIPSVSRPSARGWLEGGDLRALARAADGLEVPFYEPSAERVAADAHDVIARAGAIPRAILRPGHPDCEGAGDLAAKVAALRAQGVDDVSFYNYGLLRPHNFAWIAHALAGEGP